jgi:hypothetical protein
MSTTSTPWITIAESDLATYVVGLYGTAMTGAALASGQGDTFTPVMTDVVNEIRSAIRGGCVKNVTPIVVSLTPLSIPPELKRHAMSLIIEGLADRLARAGIKLGKDAIEKTADRARAFIDLIRKGEQTVTMPPDPEQPDDQQRSAPSTVVHASRRRYTGRKLRGLL